MLWPLRSFKNVAPSKTNDRISTSYLPKSKIVCVLQMCTTTYSNIEVKLFFTFTLISENEQTVGYPRLCPYTANYMCIRSHERVN